MNNRLVFQRLRTFLIGLAAAAFLAPAGASAATTLGTTFAPTSGGFCFAGALYVQATSPAASSYAMPTAGVLTSWSFEASSIPPNVNLVLARATANPLEYLIVGASAVKSPTASTLNTYTDISIPVQAGDVLGLRVSSNGDCLSANGQAGFTNYGKTADPATNTTVTFSPLSTDSRKLDISAVLEPDLDGDGLGDETQDTDDDGDGVADGSDNCESVANADQANIDGDALGDVCDADDDGDGVADTSDNCATIANADQANLDSDAQGDACDADDDGDGVVDSSDNCSRAANADQVDRDGDGLGDACDAHTTVPADTTPPADTTAPVLSALSLSASRFQAARSGPAFAARVGAKVSFSVSDAATVTFTVQRKTTGRRVAGTCKAQTRVNRSQKRCTRWAAVKGSFSIQADQGATSIRFRGRIGGKQLKPGSYRINGQATDEAGNRSATKRTAFRIVT